MIAFSTAQRIPHNPSALTASITVLLDEARLSDWLFLAVAECVEEAVLNSLCRATTLVGRDGQTRHALPVEQVKGLGVRRGLEIGRLGD